MSMLLALSSKFSRTAIFGLVLSLGLISLDHFLVEFGFQPISTSVYAQEKRKPDQRKTRRTPALRNKVYEKLAAAQAALEIKDFATARKTLDGMLEAGGKNELNSYELANVYNLYAFIYYSEEDYDGALRAYRNVIKQPDIPLALEINTRFTVAQLYFVQEKWQRGIDELLDWFELNENLFKAIMIEKAVMTGLLFFVVLIAIFNIMVMISMTIENKKGDIAILKSLGYNQRDVTHIFLIQGCAANIMGVLGGIIISLLVLYNLNHIESISRSIFNFDFFPPGLYILDSMPFIIKSKQFVWISLMTIMMGLVVSYLPSRITSRYTVPKLMRLYRS